jgi:regulator of protease activity HflC (stomatin/prohibitin superfamily)
MLRFIRSYLDRARQVIKENHVLLTGVAFVFLFLIVYLSKNIFIFLQTGHAGVMYRRFGGGTDVRRVYGEGLQIISPWNTLTPYDVRLQKLDHVFTVLTTNGLSVGVSVSIRYQPLKRYLGLLHKEVGTNYPEKVILPGIQALMRNIFGQYTAEELYTSKREMVQQLLQGSLNEVRVKYIELFDVLVLAIKLPTTIEAAIEHKLTEEQRLLEMEYRLAREREEAKRKVIEAVGVNEAQRLITESLNEQILRYKGIEATKDLALSENAKIVVIGDPKGLPLIYAPALSESNGKTNKAAAADLKPAERLPNPSVP